VVSKDYSYTPAKIVGLLIGLILTIVGVSMVVYGWIAERAYLYYAVIPIIIGFVLIYSINVKKKPDKIQENESALDILKKRYARGEIAKEEFDKLKKDLENS